MNLFNKSKTVNNELQYRLLLHKNELFRLPKGDWELQVLSGQAWVSMPQKDIVLRSGEREPLHAEANSTLLSALGHDPLVVEAWGPAKSV